VKVQSGILEKEGLTTRSQDNFGIWGEGGVILRNEVKCVSVFTSFPGIFKEKKKNNVTNLFQGNENAGGRVGGVSSERLESLATYQHLTFDIQHSEHRFFLRFLLHTSVYRL